MEQIYRGIIPYDEDNSFRFAGRTDETWMLYERIIRNDYTVYYAASGEGKSSLIRAGLLPILRRRGFFPVYIVFKDEELKDINAIESVLYSRIAGELQRHKDIRLEYSTRAYPYLEELSPEKKETLENYTWWKLRNYSFKCGNKELTPLFIFDQFEEVFTKTGYKWTDRFFGWLEEISTDYIPKSLENMIDDWEEDIDLPLQKNFKALFSFRTEYLGDLDYWCVQKHFLPSLQENRMCLKPLTSKGAKEVVALNKEFSGKYADLIIQGCSENNPNVEDEDMPCVYALILSVVCQTLSDMSDSDMGVLLADLVKDRDETIDRILFRFYRQKLTDAGLDYSKDEKIIERIEDALVDENGKRRRRDTDERSMEQIDEWIEKLSHPNNGLVKVIAKKEKNGQEVKTVEFPHDRLCKAIDSARKTRQGRLAEMLNRQKEWLLFVSLTATMAAVCFLWYMLIPTLDSVISGILYSKGLEIAEQFVSNYILFDKAEYVLRDELIVLDEGFSSLSLMLSLLIFIPLLLTFSFRKGRKWMTVSFVLSCLSVVCFGFLWMRNSSIEFTYKFVNAFTIVSFFVSLAVMSISGIRIVNSSRKKIHTVNSGPDIKWWPLWGGYFIFAAYLFYEFLFRTTFGINEPYESSWAVTVLPVLYYLCAWGFFNMKFRRSRVEGISAIMIGLLSLISLSVLGLVHPYEKQQYGMPLSVCLIVVALVASCIIFLNSDSRSKYYVMTATKRVSVISLGIAIVITSFILHLGYNPVAICPKTVCQISSWRTVVVADNVSKDSSVCKNLGILYPDGDTIVPCCIFADQEIIKQLKKGKSPFDRGDVSIKGKFESDPVNLSNNYFEWNSLDSTATGHFLITPTLEEYLYDIKTKGLKGNRSLKDSIDYYAARLYSEIREANIDYMLTSEPYGHQNLESLDILDSLQRRSLNEELHRFSDRKDFDRLEDKHLVDFQRELSKSFLICMIKDRVNQTDIPSLFNLMGQYLLAFFPYVPEINTSVRFTYKTTINLNGNESHETTNVLIETQDILEDRLFAWYQLFSGICKYDMSLNKNIFEGLYGEKTSYLDNIKDIKDILELQQNQITSRLENLLITVEDNILYNRNIKTRREQNDIQLEEIPDIFSEFVSESVAFKSSLKDTLLSIQNDFEDFFRKNEPLINAMDVIGMRNETDESLDQIVSQVIDTLLPVMEQNENGIYNNAFENICTNLVLVLAFRGNETKEIQDRLSTYMSSKNEIYKSVSEIQNINQKAVDLKNVFKEIYISSYRQSLDMMEEIMSQAQNLNIIS